MKEFYKNIRACINTLCKSWTEITAENIKDAWNKILTLPPEQTGTTDLLGSENQAVIVGTTKLEEKKLWKNVSDNFYSYAKKRK